MIIYYAGCRSIMCYLLHRTRGSGGPAGGCSGSHISRGILGFAEERQRSPGILPHTVPQSTLRDPQHQPAQHSGGELDPIHNLLRHGNRLLR